LLGATTPTVCPPPVPLLGAEPEPEPLEPEPLEPEPGPLVPDVGAGLEFCEPAALEPAEPLPEGVESDAAAGAEGVPACAAPLLGAALSAAALVLDADESCPSVSTGALNITAQVRASIAPVVARPFRV
jgi:hypothetical protein